MTRGFGGRIHPRHVRSIHNSTQSDDRGSQQQRPQYSSQASGQQQSSFRPPTPRGRGARGLRRKIWGPAQEDLLLILWWRQGPQYKNVSNHHPKEKGDCRSRSPTKSTEASPAHCFVPFTLHTRIFQRSCCFGQSATSFLATTSTSATTIACLFSRPAARRESTDPSATRFQGGVRSSHS
jgi:hypothetical protein